MRPRRGLDVLRPGQQLLGSPPSPSATREGSGVRRKVFGRTETEVKVKLRELRRDMENGVRPSATYTVGAALDDWLANGLSGRSDRTRELYRDTDRGAPGAQVEGS